MIYKNNRQLYIKRFISTLVISAVLAASLVTQSLTTTPVDAWGCDEAGREARADFYSQNDIQFIDPCESGGACASGIGTLTGPPPTSLRGEDNAEKTWNYFRDRGLSPIAAAGAMGNIEHESGFNPWIGESGSTSISPSTMGVGFGLIQWTNTDGNANGRRAGIINAMQTAGINLGNINQNDQAQTDIALMTQLNWLWDGEYKEMTWQEPVNNETKIDGDTNIASYHPAYSSQRAESQVDNGTTLLFHALVERSGDTPSMLQERVDGAKAWLDKFSGGGPGGDCATGGTTDIVEMAKKVTNGTQGLQRMSGLRGGITGLDCGDCVAFVTTVYVAAGYPKPLDGSYNDEDSGIHDAPGGNGGNLPMSGYAYDPTNYEVIPNDQKQPGDILAWSSHVAIYAGGSNAYEGGGGPGSTSSNYGNIGETAWFSVESAEVLRYKGPPIQ